MTRLAPASRWALALSFEVKKPVHSSAMSTLSSRCGSSPGLRMAVTRILRPLTTMSSPSTVTSLGKRPCTESKRRRWALVSIGPRSFTASTSMSLRPDSTMARRMLRPMRPNPLIATLTVMSESSSQIMRAQHLVGDGLGRDSEVPVEVLVGRARAETLHADEDAVGTDERVPAEAHRRLDRDLDRRIANDPAADWFRLGEQQVERGHRHDAGSHAAPGEQGPGRKRDLDLGARGEERRLGLALGRPDLIGAGGAAVVLA